MIAYKHLAAADVSAADVCSFSKTLPERDTFQIVNKTAIIKAINRALGKEFEALRSTSQKTRAAGNDVESKAEGKYDTRATEDNYLADGLARQAQAAAEAGAACNNFTPRTYAPDDPIDIGALVQLAFADGTHWFILGPAGGGIEVVCDGVPITVLAPGAPLTKQLIGLKVGDSTARPQAQVCSVE